MEVNYIYRDCIAPLFHAYKNRNENFVSYLIEYRTNIN